MRLLRRLIALARGRSTATSMAQVVFLRSLAIGVNMCTGMVTAAFLGPAGRGEQAALTIGPMLLAPFAVFGLHASFIYNAKADPENERLYLGANLLMTGIAGVVVAMIGWVIEPYWLRHYSAATIALGRVYLLVTPLTVMTWGLLASAEARGWFFFANRIQYLQSLLTLAILFAVIKLHVLTPATAAAAYIVPSIPAFCYFGFEIWRRVGPVFTLRSPFPARLIKYGIRFYGIDLLGMVTNYLDQIVVVALLAPGLVGIYTVAISLARVLTVLQAAVSSVLFPKIAAKSLDHVVPAVAATLRLTTVVTASVALGLAIVGPYMLPLLYGDRFLPAVPPLRILLADVVVANSARVLYQSYTGSGRPEIVTGFEVMGLIVSLTSMLLIVPGYGLVGAACCVLLASVTRLLLAISGLKLILHVKIPRLVLGASDIRNLIAFFGPMRARQAAGQISP